jgi:hypothetical protein
MEQAAAPWAATKTQSEIATSNVTNAVLEIYSLSGLHLVQEI